MNLTRVKRTSCSSPWRPSSRAVASSAASSSTIPRRWRSFTDFVVEGARTGGPLPS